MRMTRAAQPPFQVFFDEQAGAVATLLAGLVGAEDVEECLQETFIAALRNYERFDGRHPRAWILAIARRKAVDLHRSRVRRPVPLEAVDEIPAGAGASTLHGPIWADVAALPDKQRVGVLLRYALDMRHAEIGAVLGCSEAAARRSVHEGIAKLRKIYVEEEAI